MTLEEIQEGMPVLSIPQHAQGKRTHPDCQRGMVTGKTAPHVLVRYGTDRHSNTTAPAFLVPDAPGALGLGWFSPRQTAAVVHGQRRAGGVRRGGLLGSARPPRSHTRGSRSPRTRWATTALRSIRMAVYRSGELFWDTAEAAAPRRVLVVDGPGGRAAAGPQDPSTRVVMSM